MSDHLFSKEYLNILPFLVMCVCFTSIIITLIVMSIDYYRFKDAALLREKDIESLILDQSV